MAEPEVKEDTLGQCIIPQTNHEGCSYMLTAMILTDSPFTNDVILSESLILSL
ncbi:hypothetical protein PCANC_20631 [Puccinia coronata f. sp. avenae]|uniref:Uncharacterized protein n=1 Tax=Puccinia coronata f. sp. avenae TaxID=200324 RepID=A0A2N5SJ06_9BASI|nr:hypothetical protein PCANC_20631 [Puccinia coronata f. sp. avenae]PLW35722.1 hypothetical protein PCASD_13116 [Puccinia coronata f. sp. avenae]